MRVPSQTVRRRVIATIVSSLAVAFATFALVPAAYGATPIITVLKASTSVPENGTVTVGEKLTVKVSGFAGGATVVLQFGTAPIGGSITTDVHGTGQTAVVVPSVPSDAYLLTASDGRDVATFAVSVANPSAPAAAGAASSSAKPTTSSPTSPQLAKSGGSSTPSMWGWAAALILLGGVLIRIAAPALFGRHQRIGGSHLRSPMHESSGRRRAS